VQFVPLTAVRHRSVPLALFNSVADNLIRNALAKQRGEPGIRVRVSLEEDAVRVCDTGSAVPAHIARDLTRAPVASAAGLGIGLYQAARQAEASGYRLVLEKNENGAVCFALQLVRSG
jgi:signal transduction histidine kinase